MAPVVPIRTIARGLPAGFTPTVETATAAAVPGAARTAAVAAERAARRLRTRLVDRQTTPFERHLVEALDRGAGAFFGLHLHERETARLPGRTITDEADRLHRPGFGKQVLDSAFLGGKRQVADIQLQIHLRSSSRPFWTDTASSMRKLSRWTIHHRLLHGREGNEGARIRL